jgi:nicotinate-nucleotide adenylyltransferase
LRLPDLPKTTSLLVAPSNHSLLALPASLGDRRRRRVGLLGGSFNPAHGGHLHISREALRHLRLDEIWWLVSPQNPLKPASGMAPLVERLASAAAIVSDKRIRVTDIETRLGTRFTADTLSALKRRFPRARFVWLMGADNLAQIRHWARWQQIFHTVPIAVLARPSYCLEGLSDLPARRFARRRVPPEQARYLADLAPPAWAFFSSRLDASSATQIRSRLAAGSGRKKRIGQR